MTTISAPAREASSRDDHDFGTSKRGLQPVSSHEARDTSRGLNVGEVSSDSRGGNDVIEGQLADCWVQLQQHGQGLANASSGSHDSHADIVGRGGGEGAGNWLGEPGEHVE